MNFDRIGLGTWQLAGPLFNNSTNVGWGKIDEQKAIDIILTAIDFGIDFFDSAEEYGNGKAEEILGKAIPHNYKVKVCSKFGLYQENGISIRDFSPERLEVALRQSLKRLNRDYLDYYLLHSPTLEEITDELIDKLVHFKNIGLIKKIGLSVTFLEKYQGYFDVFDCFEIVYNEITKNNLEYLNQLENKEVFARSIFASGLLLKPVEELFPEKYTDWRNQLNPIVFEKARNYISQQKNNSSIALIEKGLAYPFKKIIIGVREIEQFKFN